MKIKNLNKKIFGLSLCLTYTSICSGCTIDKKTEDLIGYEDLIANYKVVEFETFDEQSIHIVKKKKIDNMINCYGYYDIMHDSCIVKVDEEQGVILGNGIISNIVEMNIQNYLDKYSIEQYEFTKDELGCLIEMIRDDYDAKVLVK